MADDDVYQVVSGSLNLKGVADGGVKKKKKKSKAKKVLLDQKTKIVSGDSSTSDESRLVADSEAPVVKDDNRTPAQIAYDKVQEKRAAERLLTKASKSHKERVAEFNAKLDNLSEHYDIPKVSWTK